MGQNFVVAPSRNRIVQDAFAGLAAAQLAEKKTASKKGAKAEVAYPKDAALRSEPYRRLVASGPCKHCHVSGFSQAAHPPCNGKAIKQDDRECFALCSTRPGPKGAVQGCHEKFDQYKLFPHDKAMKKARQWAAETRAEIEDADLWPKKLARYPKGKP